MESLETSSIREKDRKTVCVLADIKVCFLLRPVGVHYILYYGEQGSMESLVVCVFVSSLGTER